MAYELLYAGFAAHFRAVEFGLERLVNPDVTVDVSFFFQAEDGIRDTSVTGVQTCALPISRRDAPADAADVRGARPDRAQALAEGHAPVLAARRRHAAPHPGDDDRSRAQPRRRRARAGARAAARARDAAPAGARGALGPDARGDGARDRGGPPLVPRRARPVSRPDRPRARASA